MKRKLALLLFVLALLSGFPNKSVGQMTTIKAGTIGIMPEAAFFIGLEKGYFAEVGIKLELIPFDSGAKMVAPLATGELQLAAGGGISAGLFNAFARGLPIIVVASNTYTVAGNSTGHLLVRTDLKEKIKRPADLKGRKVAINVTGSPIHYVLGKALERDGLSMKDIDMVTVPFPDMVAAFRNKAIEAALSPEPTATLMQQRGVAVRWATAQDFAPNMEVNDVFYNRDWAERNPRLANDLMMAWLRGARFYYDALSTGKNRDEVAGILAKHTPVKDKTLYEKMEWVFIDPNGQIVKESLSDQQEWYHRQGLVKDKVDIEKLVHERYIKFAVEKLGLYPCERCAKRK